MADTDATFAYSARDAGGNHITRDGLTLTELATQYANLVTCGYVVLATMDGAPMADGALASLARGAVR